MIVLKVQSRIGRAAGEVPTTEVQRASFVSYTGGEGRSPRVSISVLGGSLKSGDTHIW